MYVAIRLAFSVSEKFTIHPGADLKTIAAYVPLIGYPFIRWLWN
tara:strand:+ start:273 stop:404 length:132 start_codon:yes stop_codon:yes gene_type:complete